MRPLMSLMVDEFIFRRTLLLCSPDLMSRFDVASFLLQELTSFRRDTNQMNSSAGVCLEHTYGCRASWSFHCYCLASDERISPGTSRDSSHGSTRHRRA